MFRPIFKMYIKMFRMIMVKQNNIKTIYIKNFKIQCKYPQNLLMGKCQKKKNQFNMKKIYIKRKVKLKLLAIEQISRIGK